MSWIKKFQRSAPVESRLLWLSAAQTSTGPVRSHNEDRVRVLHIPVGSARATVAAVADGMGGHAAGEWAAQMALDVIEAFWMNHTPVEIGTMLKQSIAEANAAIWRDALNADARQGMGTTIALAVALGSQVWLAHVGDSRIYRLHAGDIEQMTKDDALGAAMQAAGLWDQNTAATHPDRDALSQAVGTRPVVDHIHVQGPVPVQAGDRFLLCSDGLHNVLSDAEFLSELMQPEPAAAAQALIERACRKGTRDNVSAVVLFASDVESHGGTVRGTGERCCV